MTASTALSAAALIVAIATAVWSGWYSHRTANEREVNAWRRNELLTCTSELLQLSSHRQAVLIYAFDARVTFRSAPGGDPFDVEESGGPHPRHSVDRMIVLAERISLIDDAVAVAARSLATAHRDALIEADAEYELTPDPVSHIDGMMVPRDDLMKLHRELAFEFRRASGITQKEPPPVQ